MNEWRALCVDDDQNILNTIEEWFNSDDKSIPGIGSLKIDPESNFDRALNG